MWSIVNVLLQERAMDITFSFGWIMIGDGSLMLGLFVKLILDGVNSKYQREAFSQGEFFCFIIDCLC